MKAPDIIYMPNELLTENWERHIEGQDTAYVKLDAILKWANGMSKASASFSEELAYNELMEHIRSL